MKKEKLNILSWCKYVLFSFMLLSSGNLLSQDITGGLMLHYDFDQLTTNSVSVTDVSRNGHFADIYGTHEIVEGRTGEKTDKSIMFVTPGTPTSDYLHLPDDITSVLTDFTISVWIKLNAINNWMRVFDFGSGTDTNMFLTAVAGEGTVRFAIKRNGSAEQVVNGQFPLPVGEWCHVVVTGDYSANTVKLYVNGDLSGQNTNVTITPESLGIFLPQNYIGKSQYASDAPLLGCVDDFRIYNRALSRIDVYKLYGYTDEEIEELIKQDKEKPLFDPSEEYAITCYNARAGGVEIPETETYPLMHNPSIGRNTDRAFWIFKEERKGEYSIKNAVTNQYIKYIAGDEHYDTRYIELVMEVDTLFNTTLFTFNPVTRGGIDCYAIVSVADPEQVFNKRTPSNIVGTYRWANNRNFSDEELFIIKKKNTLPLEVLKGDGKLFTYLNTFTLNKNDLAPCTNEKIYYYSIPLSQMNSDVTVSVEFVKKNAVYSLKIDGQVVTDKSSFTFKNVKTTGQHKIEILQDDSVIATEYIIFTGLPIVQLYTNGNSLSTDFSRGKVKIHDTFKKSIPYELLNMEIRHRGAITLNYQKKSFAIKIKDANWINIDRNFFGLRTDQYWILDACAIDKSRMRNRVCTDLWNEFSADPHFKKEEPKMINGTTGQYVEVFLDDQYWGLYCMTERVDRKQLKLKKFEETTGQMRGLLYKATDWSYSVMMGYVPWEGPNPSYNIPNYDNKSEVWEKFEIDYPDVVDGEPIDWKPLYDVVKFVAHSSTQDFINGIGKYIDLPVWIDYYLLMELILAVDNHGKNCYVYVYDITQEHRLGIAVWDMDAVLGRRWNASAVYAAQNYPQYTINNEWGEHNLFRRLRETNALNYNDLTKKRYDELRFTYFAPENILKRFQDYKKLFEDSGAADREIKRWNGVNGIDLDFDVELEYLRGWLATRTTFLNKQYGDPPSNTEKENKLAGYSFYPNPVSSTFYINNVEYGTLIRVYSQQGVPVYSGKAENPEVLIDFSNYHSGCYYLKVGDDRGKVIIKR